MTNKASRESGGSADILSIPVWLHASKSFYKKLNQIAKRVPCVSL